MMSFPQKRATVIGAGALSFLVPRAFRNWSWRGSDVQSTPPIETRFGYRTCLISALTLVATLSGSGA
jgi:hypothetical protein